MDQIFSIINYMYSPIFGAKVYTADTSAGIANGEFTTSADGFGNVSIPDDLGSEYLIISAPGYSTVAYSYGSFFSRDYQIKLYTSSDLASGFMDYDGFDIPFFPDTPGTGSSSSGGIFNPVPSLPIPKPVPEVIEGASKNTGLLVILGAGLLFIALK